jgi:hypothetical protein
MTIHPDIAPYIERGLRLVFWHYDQDDKKSYKGPNGKDAVGWTTKGYRPEDYQPGMNVGVMLGVEIVPGRFNLDVDFDWDPGLRLTRRILPATGFGFGRASRKVSHAFFTDARPHVSVKYEEGESRRGRVISSVSNHGARGTDRNGTSSAVTSRITRSLGSIRWPDYRTKRAVGCTACWPR